MHIHSFPPIVNSSSRLLILGSIPGKVSLEAGEYYAHPQNLFWRFMESHIGVDRTMPYKQRVAHLLGGGVALWDVLKTCTRASSLDSEIVASSIVLNDFASLFGAYPSIRTICFNGRKAADSFKKHAFPNLGDLSNEITFHSLPSTSPANASIPFERKLAAWSVVAPAH